MGQRSSNVDINGNSSSESSEHEGMNSSKYYWAMKGRKEEKEERVSLSNVN